MPPIRKGDGTAVAPKGISQVRTGDGRIFFDGPAILDSAIHHWRLDEGSGSTLSDDVGSFDAERIGASWTSGDWEGNYALDGDGSDDYIETHDWDITLGGSFAVLVTFSDYTSSGNHVVGGAGEGGDDNVRLGDLSGSYGLSDGDPGINVVEGGDNMVVESNVTVDDGDTYRIAYNFDGGSPDDWSVWVNGNDNSSVDTDQGGDISNLSNNIDWTFLALNEDGSIDRNTDAIVDNIIVCDDSLSESEIQDDYDNQPWS